MQYNKSNLWKKFFLGAIFTIFVMYLFYFKNLIDFWFIEKIGYEGIAAFQLVFPLIFLVIAIWEGVSIAINNLVSISLGKKDLKQKDIYITTGFIFVIFVGILIYLFGDFFVKQFLSFFDVTEKIKKLAFEYGSIIFKYSGIYYINAIIWALIIVYHRYILQVFIGIIYVFGNIFFNWLFFYKYGWGIAGIAYASVLVELVLAILGILYFVFMDKVFVLRIKENFDNFKFYFTKYFNYWLAGFLSLFIFVFEFISNNYFVSKFGDYALASYGMIKIFFDFVSYPIFGIGIVFISIYGYFLGEKNVGMLNYFKLRFLKGYIVYLLGGVILIWNGVWVFKLFFSVEEQIVNYLIILTHVFAMFFVFFGFNFFYSQILQVRGFHKQRIFFNILLVVFIIFFEYIFYNLFKTFNAVWYGWLLAQILVTLFLFLYYKVKVEKCLLKS